jgi:hypothetical protein
LIPFARLSQISAPNNHAKYLNIDRGDVSFALFQ